MDLNYFDRMALATFTSLEKQSLYQLLCAAMIIDGERDPRELALIGEVNRIIGITTADMEASRRLSEPTMTIQKTIFLTWKLFWLMEKSLQEKNSFSTL